jgi:hypothetical protein
VSRSLTVGWVCVCDGLKEKRGRDGLLCGMEEKEEKRKKKEEKKGRGACMHENEGERK